MINDEILRNVRTLFAHYGRLMAIKYLRSKCGLCYLRAKVAFEDITTNQPWTRPHIKADAWGMCEFPAGTTVSEVIAAGRTHFST